MNHSIRILMLVMLACFLSVGCSKGTSNVTANASQEKIDEYNDLLKQAENEMKNDGNDGEVDE